MTTGRDKILGKLRPLVHDAQAADARLKAKPRSTPLAFPSSPQEIIERFAERAVHSAATAAMAANFDAVPHAVAAYLTEQRQPLQAKRATDAVLDSIPWLAAPSLSVQAGLPSPHDLCAITIAAVGIAETGSLLMMSTKTTPYLMNFLPETLVVILPVARIVPLLEDGFARWRSASGNIARNFTLMTGPSRTGDIEQTLEIGAHGPKRQLIVIVNDR